MLFLTLRAFACTLVIWHLKDTHLYQESCQLALTIRLTAVGAKSVIASGRASLKYCCRCHTLQTSCVLAGDAHLSSIWGQIGFCWTLSVIWSHALFSSMPAYPPVSDFRPGTCNFRWLNKLVSVFTNILDHLLSVQSAPPHCYDTTCSTPCSTTLTTITHVFNKGHLLRA